MGKKSSNNISVEVSNGVEKSRKRKSSSTEGPKELKVAIQNTTAEIEPEKKKKKKREVEGKEEIKTTEADQKENTESKPKKEKKYSKSNQVTEHNDKSDGNAKKKKDYNRKKNKAKAAADKNKFLASESGLSVTIKTYVKDNDISDGNATAVVEQTAVEKSKKLKDYNRKKNKAKALAERRKLQAAGSCISTTEKKEEETPKKKKKEKKPKDKTLEAFNKLRKANLESEDEKEEELVQPKKVKKVKKADHIHETKGQNRALKYLESWNEFLNGENPGWKFQKVPQIWLLANLYNPDRIPDKKFDLLLKYMDSIKGKMRQASIESAKLKVQLEEKWVSALEVDEDKSEEEDKSKKEKTLPVETRPSQKEVDRAKEVIVMLEDE